ncbi:hypothetical protein MJO28_006991 [Puccinia striiformis f. sp. tritici]|uniref:Uncharacterized protein n=1 Tax=Puccinia striiformis f. sp. tritici TaxID=168172 RepID=A0ACC0EEQ3_9BASI|nr:hypothetical protein MJO28_006991 [Puccinia striiformis f. sp. tritici]
MANPLASALDLIKAFLPHKDVADNQMVPALVHSGSQKRTLTALALLSLAILNLKPHTTSAPHAAQ